MNAVGFASDAPGRLVPKGISAWSAQTWEVLTVAVIMVSVTSWVISHKRGRGGPGCEGRGSLAVDILLQVVILAPTMLLCYWGSSCPHPLRAVGMSGPTVAALGESVVLRCEAVDPLRAVGMSGPTVAALGESVVLGCEAVTCTHAGSVGLEWRNLRSGDVVLACGEGGGECWGYREGAWLLDGRRGAGDVSLRLDRVGVTDAGTYQCTVFTGSRYSAARMDLSVVALGTKPVISVERLTDSTVLYSCRSAGWLPEPALVWKSSDGTSLVPRSNVTRTRCEGGLHGVEIMHRAHQDVPDTVICIVHNTVTNVKVASAARTSDLLRRTEVGVGESGKTSHESTKHRSAQGSEPGGQRASGN